MRKLIAIFLLLLGVTFASAQAPDFKYFKDLEWRNIGPAGMSGRITAIDVNLQDKDHIIIGSASGGVWESKNGGISWKPLFDDQPTLSIGAVKFNQNNPAEIWVGTGEGNPRNSHNSGAGVFKSIDGGKTWTYMGLKETKLIHRIIIHDDDPKTVFIGALGSAWGSSQHRGVYKTNDGGKTWKKVLYTSDQAGVADMVVDPSNPNKLIAAMWEFGRTPWNFNSGGKSSGLYLSYDAGESWKRLTNEEGLPKGDLGRIGIAFAPSKPNIVYALVEAKNNGLYKSTDGGEKWSLVSSKNIGNRPFYYAEIYVDPKNENRIYNLWSYVSRSEDGGKSFTTIMDYGNAVHPDHHALWIDPDDSNYLINGNDGGLNISRDGAASWQFVGNLPVGQFYHVSVDNDFPYNVYGGMQDNGSWVGPGFVLKSGGIRNYDWQELYFGDGFDVAARKDNSRYGYAMSQEGNLASYDRVTGRTEFIQPQHPDGEKLRYNWNAALALDPFNDCGLYYGSQYVHYSDDCGKSWSIISPDLTSNDSLKQDQSRSGGLTLDITGAENHTTILCIEPSNSDANVLYASTDDGRLHRTVNGGMSWTDLSDRLPDLPADCWIPQVQISSTNENEIFVVVNNYRLNDWSAYLYHSMDNGSTWNRIVDDSDVDGFVCSVLQDPEEPNLVFLGTDVGLYFSIDHGGSWQKWEKGLPNVQIRDMKIQTEHDDLVLGTFGRSFWILDNVKVLRKLAREGYRILEKELIAFENPTVYLTSSRSYDGVRFGAQGEYIGDNKYTGAQFTIWKRPESMAADSTTISEDETGMGEEQMSEETESETGDDQGEGDEESSEQKDSDKKPAKKKKDDKLKIKVVNARGDTIRSFERKIKDGFNRISWRPDQKGVRYPSKSEPREDYEPGGMPIIPGNYTVIFELNENREAALLRIVTDPRVEAGLFDAEDKYNAMDEFNKSINAARDAFDNLKKAKKTLDLHKNMIEIEVDSLKEEFAKNQKHIKSQLDSLMNLYMLPDSRKTEYRDNSETLNSKLYKANNFLRASTGAPTANGQIAVDQAEEAVEEAVNSINSFFESDWNDYIEYVKNLPLSVYETFKPVKIE